MFCDVKYIMIDQNQNNIISKMHGLVSFQENVTCMCTQKKLICYTQRMGNFVYNYLSAS